MVFLTRTRDPPIEELDPGDLLLVAVKHIGGYMEKVKISQICHTSEPYNQA